MKCTYFLSCITADKGSFTEAWINKATIANIAGLKTAIITGIEPSEKDTFTVNNFIFSTANAENHRGRRERGFFLCPLTEEYVFFFSCATSCEWSIKETEQSEEKITGGSASYVTMGVDKQLSQINRTFSPWCHLTTTTIILKFLVSRGHKSYYSLLSTGIRNFEFEKENKMDRPFYSCVLSDLALDWKWGWVTLF